MSGKILDSDGINRTLRRVSHEILENCDDFSKLAIVGIKTRGEYLAQRIVKNILEFEGEKVSFSTLDTSYFRDDVADKHNISADKSGLEIDVNGKYVVLVDDVLYTGRTTRAAMDAIMLSGRPSSIKLAVLVDRGHRELPIRADYVGKNIPTSSSGTVNVYLNETDKKEYIEIK